MSAEVHFVFFVECGELLKGGGGCLLGYSKHEYIIE